MVFWRVTGTKLEPAEDVDAREGVWSIETAIVGAVRTSDGQRLLFSPEIVAISRSANVEVEQRGLWNAARADQTSVSAAQTRIASCLNVP